MSRKTSYMGSSDHLFVVDLIFIWPRLKFIYSSFVFTDVSSLRHTTNGKARRGILGSAWLRYGHLT